MRSVYQKNPINLTSAYNNAYVGGVKKNLINAEISKYFHMVVIGKRGKSKSSTITSTVPLLSLFVNGEYRKRFLAYTANLTDESIVRLRNVLADDSSCKKNYALIAEAIGDSVRKHGLKEYEIATCEYTYANHLQGGEKVRYYINTDGVPSTDPSIKDLTPAYRFIKEYRAKGNQVSAEVKASQVKRA